MDEQLKVTHKVIDVTNRANRKVFVALLRCNVDKSESSNAQVELIARKREVEKFQQIVYVIFSVECFISVLEVMKSVNDKVIINQPICNVL